jgi:hypothetical protein
MFWRKKLVSEKLQTKVDSWLFAVVVYGGLIGVARTILVRE